MDSGADHLTGIVPDFSLPSNDPPSPVIPSSEVLLSEISVEALPVRLLRTVLLFCNFVTGFSVSSGSLSLAIILEVLLEREEL